MISEDFVDVLGIHISRLGKKEAEEKIERSLCSDTPLTIFTPNPEIIMRAQKDKEFGARLNSADILLPDGIGVVIASRLLHDPLPERITGIDTGEFILKLADEHSIPVFLLGARPGVAERAATEIKARYPSIKEIGAHHGYFEKHGPENDAVINAINDSGARILFVCFGAPMQETWISENKSALKSVKLYTGLGGALDVWAKDVRRAPKILQSLGLEWLWRICKEPRRAAFLLKMPCFLCKVLCSKISN